MGNYYRGINLDSSNRSISLDLGMYESAMNYYLRKYPNMSKKELVDYLLDNGYYYKGINVTSFRKAIIDMNVSKISFLNWHKDNPNATVKDFVDYTIERNKIEIYRGVTLQSVKAICYQLDVSIGSWDCFRRRENSKSKKAFVDYIIKKYSKVYGITEDEISEKATERYNEIKKKMVNYDY